MADENQEPPPAVVIADAGADPTAAALEVELAREGLRVTRVALEPPETLDERAAVARIDAAAAELAREAGAVIALGVGAGGTLAFVAACASRHVAGCAALDAPLVYPALDRRRPMQPIERAANLSGPALFLFGARSPGTGGTRRAERELLRARLDQLGKEFEIAEIDEKAGGSAGHELLRVLLAFLRRRARA